MSHSNINTNDCWLYAGWINPYGYGYIREYADHKYTTYMAHRLMYEAHKGEIPSELVIDHLCRQPQCINPDHLDTVSLWENTLRGENFMAKLAKATHCKRGHEFTKENTNIRTSGRRQCKTCKRLRERGAIVIV